MSFFRFLSKSFGFCLLSLALFLVFVLFFYAQILATFPTLSASVPGNISFFVATHQDEFKAYVENMTGTPDICNEGNQSLEMCQLLSNTSIITQQFGALPPEFYTEEYFPAFTIASEYKPYVVLGAIVFFLLGILFVFFLFLFFFSLCSRSFFLFTIGTRRFPSSCGAFAYSYSSPSCSFCLIFSASLFAVSYSDLFLASLHSFWDFFVSFCWYMALPMEIWW